MCCCEEPGACRRATKQSHSKEDSLRGRKEALAPGHRIVTIARSIPSNSEGTRNSEVNRKRRGISNEAVSK